MPEFDSNGRLTTTPISISTVFDEVTIEMDDPFKIGSVHVVERTGEGTIIRGRVPAEYRHHNPDFNTSNPEVAEIAEAYRMMVPVKFCMKKKNWATSQKVNCITPIGPT